MRVLNYNVRGLRDDRRALLQIIAELDPDVAIIQEVPKVFFTRYRSHRFARQARMVPVIGGAWSCGNFLMVRPGVTVSEARQWLYPLTPGEQMRGAVVADVSYRGEALRVVGTHLSLRADERERQVAHLFEELGAEGPPLLIAGDMNEPPGGPVWRTLADRLTDASGEDETYTFSTRRPRRRLDGIFVEPELTVRSYTVHESPLVQRASDHFPVLVEVSHVAAEAPVAGDAAREELAAPESSTDVSTPDVAAPAVKKAAPRKRAAKKTASTPDGPQKTAAKKATPTKRAVKKAAEVAEPKPAKGAAKKASKPTKAAKTTATKTTKAKASPASPEPAATSTVDDAASVPAPRKAPRPAPTPEFRSGVETQGP